MLITICQDGSRKGARESLNKLNARLLGEIYQENFFIHELPDITDILFFLKYRYIYGYIDGITEQFIKAAIQKIRSNTITKVFIDGSNLGLMAQEIKRNCPSVCIYTCFHNVEARFFYGSLKKTKTIKALLVMLANYLAERKSVKYSDVRIMLNLRDSEMLNKIYGKPATHISALTVPDTRFNRSINKIEIGKSGYALFVGGSFYANRYGLEWYAQNVAPNVLIKTLVVGRGFDKLKNVLEKNSNIEVIGEVDCMASWYENADFVVAPIFDGSGMKTKVGEALMFGKMVIGTSEAFCGYEDALPTAGIVCDTKEDFIDAIQNNRINQQSKYNIEAVRLYEAIYSPDAAKLRLVKILKDK